MLNRPPIRKTSPDSSLRRAPGPSEKPSPADASLILPSLSNVPTVLLPSVLQSRLEDLRSWGVILQTLDPAEVNWPAGHYVNLIAGELMKRIEEGISGFIQEISLDAHCTLEILETRQLQIRVWAYGEQPLPIYWTETLEAIATLAPDYLELAQGALALLGTVHLNWEDVKEMILEHLDAMLEEEDVPQARKRFEACGPEQSPFDLRGPDCRNRLGKRLRNVKRSLGDLSPRTDHENRVFVLIRDILTLCRFKQNKRFYPLEYEEMHLGMDQLMPVLYAREDDLSEQHFQDLEGYWNGGETIFGEQLIFTIHSSLTENQLSSQFKTFLKEVSHYPVYQHIYAATETLIEVWRKHEREALFPETGAPDLSG